MPELPEIETIKIGINQLAKSRVIKSVEIKDKKVARFSENEFNRKISGRKLKLADRRAKMLLLKTESQYGLMVHLKMTGQLVFVDKQGIKKGGGHPDKAYLGKELPHKFTRIIFRFKDGSSLYFNDIRRFGWVKIVNLTKLSQVKELKFLGPEPLSKDFSLEYFKKIINQRSRSNIKNLIMNQKIVAGIGNIYANESLFIAGIDPRRRAKQLKEREIKKLYQAIKQILNKAIKLRGTSSDTYVDVGGEEGSYKKEAYVYDREGEKCRRINCLGKIDKIKISNRGTYFCPKCQN